MKLHLFPLAFLTLAAAAQEPPTAPAGPCTGPEYRAFDFWVGEWAVTQNGQPAGRNLIESIDGGCALSESWTSAAGNFSGHSLNFYDRTTQRWHQVWVDSSGTVLRLEGGLEDGPELGDGARLQVMVLRGVTRGQDGSTVQNRITWTPNPDGSVRQHWEASSDGVTWTSAFDGRYARAGSAAE